MAIYTSKFTQQEIDDGIDNANNALPLSAGTSNALTGNLFLKSTKANDGGKVRFYKADNTTLAGYLAWSENVYGNYIELYEPITDRGIWIGNMNTDAPVYWNGTTSKQHPIWHSGNFNPANYLPLTGGTLTKTTLPIESGVLNINSTYANTWAYSLMCMCSSQGSGYRNAIAIGRTFTARNCGIMSFYWSSDGSNNNMFSFGLHSVDNILNLYGNGNVGIGMGTTLASYKLHVAGAVGATAFTNTSDIRKKDIIENINLNVEDIANAPIFKFSWLDPEMTKGVNVGTSAQYWQTIMPEIVSEANNDEKTLSMQYGVAGLASSITLAKKVVEQEKTIKAQEARIKALEDVIAEIQNKLK